MEFSAILIRNGRARSFILAYRVVPVGYLRYNIGIDLNGQGRWSISLVSASSFWRTTKRGLKARKSDGWLHYPRHHDVALLLLHIYVKHRSRLADNQQSRFVGKKRSIEANLYLQNIMPLRKAQRDGWVDT